MRETNDVTAGSAEADFIKSLPGAPAFLSKQYSGFFQITASKSIHYYYVESENKPETDSIVFWTNGGPGCSGLLGLFVELGPWRPRADGTLLRNPHSWTSLASFVFLEQPAGVGFSTTTDLAEMKTNDFNAARDNVATIKEFFRRHPSRINNTMYLASESYGGHYIPQLTIALLADKDLSKHFEGFLVGNPYTSYGSGDLGMANTLWGLQLVDAPLWDAFTANSCEKLTLNAYTLPQACLGILGAMQQRNVLNPYALNFPVCKSEHVGTQMNTKHQTLWSRSGQAKCIHKLHHRLGEYRASLRGEAFSPTAASEDNGTHSEQYLTSSGELDSDLDFNQRSHPSQHKSKSSDAGNRISGDDLAVKTTLSYDPCTQDHTVAYLNLPAVQAALNIIPLPTSPAVDWTVCSDPLFTAWSEADVYADTTGLFSEIYQTVKIQRETGEREKDFKMLIFSGDTDGVCSTVGTQHWIYSVTAAQPSNASTSLPKHFTPLTSRIAMDSYLTLSSSDSLWKPWSVKGGREGQQGGFLTTFENSFSFATVHSAGHEVPAYQPVAALSLFSGFLDGSMFTPSVTPTPSSPSGISGNNYTSIATFVVLAAATLGILSVCYLLYRRERKMRRASSGPPVSIIEYAEEDESREGPGTLTVRVPSVRTAPSQSNNYKPMPTEEAAT